MIRLAFPKNPIYNPLFEESETYSKENNIRCYRLNENECTDYMLRNLVDAAFLSPLGYGKGVKIADFRIIPGPMLFLENYTGFASIFFKPGLDNIFSLYSPTPDDFIIQIGQLVLNEKYGIDIQVNKMAGSKSEILSKYDSAILWGNADVDDISLDVSEEWYDLIEEPLPIGFWVCRAESHPPKIEKIVSSLTSSNFIKSQEIIEASSKYHERKGKVYWYWEPELESSIETMLMFLYLNQLLPEIPAVKILSRD